ncbi:hypothetical protein KR018_007140, partial [Drosophila ironensis]
QWGPHPQGPQGRQQQHSSGGSGGSGGYQQPGDNQQRQQTGDVRQRQQPGDNQQRQQTGNVWQRQQPGDNQQRQQTGDVRQRQQPGDFQQRQQTGDVRQRQQPGGVQQRQQPGDYQQRQQTGDYRQRQQQGDNRQSQQQGANRQPQQQSRAQAGGIPLNLPTGNIVRGSIGKPGQVAVNYLNINMDKMPSVAYHYDVKITPERPKKFYRQAFEQFRMNQLGGALIAYDGKASCYTVDRLKTDVQNTEVTVTDMHGRTINYNVEIKETGDAEIDLNTLRSYMTDRIFDKPMRAMQCLEVVLATPCHNKAVRAGRSFFKMSEPGQRRELDDGYEALVGLYQAFMLGDKPFLNVDISHKSFPIAMPIMEYLERYVVKSKISQSTNLDYSRRTIDSFIKGIHIVYTPPKVFGAAARAYKVNGLSREAADRQVFELDGKKLTIAEYYRSRNYKLMFPQLPCLHVGPVAKNIYVPIELCSVESGQALNRKDGATQVANMIKFAATSTNERKSKIMHLLDFFKHNLDPTISRFGISIDKDFIVVHTRTLNPPQLEYRDRRLASPRNGSWRMDQLKFLEPKPKNHKWAILHCEGSGRSLHYNQVYAFGRQMHDQSKNVNVGLEEKPDIRQFKDERQLGDIFADLKRQGCDLAIVIIPNMGASYDIIKQKAELQHGILTQCIKQFTVERKLNPQTIGNILLKVNSKLNGINHKLKEDTRFTYPKNAMFLGADVTHPSPDQREIPSVVGVAASHDANGAAYNMQYRLQRSALEEIEDMESIVLEHLSVYLKFRGNYPEHIIYYRDGVSDGQFPKIKNEELKAIYRACVKLSITPKMCCVIVVKRHHTRFFPNGEPSQYNKYNNVDPGTVVDRTIVHPNETQFFMVSHQSIQGTAKPTRYNVIMNTGKIDINVLQQMTYNLCYMFPRCNRAVSYPAPAYLAHLAAARGRVYLTGTKEFADPKREYEKRKIVPEFLKNNPMYFV